MADTVRYLLEEMIPELEELEKKGYFSRSEIKQIVQKRQDFEYHLKRRAALKKDFLRYVEYESKLEELRRHRKKTLGIKGKKGIAEVGIIRRIHFIYDRATRKFKADLSLWLEWLSVCRRLKSSKQFSKVVTKALHRHSHVPALWIQAAAWEFEHNANVAAARALMQQGLRHCRTDEVLWSEYFRMELLYVARLRARRSVLGLPNPESAEEIADLLQGALKKSGKRRKSATEETDADAAEAAVRAVLTGAVARVVYKGAAQALPDSLSIRRRLLGVLTQFSFPGIAELTQHVYDTLASDFPSEEAAWDLRARRHWPEGGLQDLPADSSDEARGETDAVTGGEAEASTSGRLFDSASHQQCCAVFREALQIVTTPKMYVYFTAYLGKRTAQLLAAASQGDADALEAAASVGAELLATYQEAFDTDHSSVEQAGLWISWALRLGQPKLALKAARRTCERWPSSPQAWSARLRLELRLQSARQRTADELFATFKSALTSVSASQGAELWSYALEAVQPGTKEWARLLDMLKLALAPGPRGPVSGGMGAVTGALLRRVFQEQGIEAVRTVCSSLLTVPPAGGDLFKAAVSVEQEHLAAQRTNLSHKEQAACEARIRKLYEAAVDVYGSEDVELWLQYAQFEREAFKGVGDVYWRATKALPDPDVFIEQYRAKIGI